MNPNQDKVKIELKHPEQSIRANVPRTINTDNTFDDERLFCRFRYGTDNDDSDLIEPCLCKGTIAKVHRNCMEKWVNISCSTQCDLCLFEIPCIQTLRYGLFQSIGLWIQLHQNQQILLYDLSFFFIINKITILTITALLWIMYDLSTNESIIQEMLNWLCVVFAATFIWWMGLYFTIWFDVVNKYIRPWFQWWKSKKQIYLAVN